MKYLKYLLPLLLICSTVVADKLMLVQLPSGQYLAAKISDTGSPSFIGIFDSVQTINAPVVTPPGPTSGPVKSIVFRIPEKLSVAAAEALIDVRDWVDGQDSKELHHYVFSPDSQDVDGTINQTVKALHDKMPTGAFYPYAFLTQKSNGKDVIVWQGELKDSAEYIERMKARLK